MCRVRVRRYKSPGRHKLFGVVLDRLYAEYMAEQKEFLQCDPGDYGRAITGDGATIMGIKFINFLIHHFGKGTMLMKIHDCTKRLREVGTIDSAYISLQMTEAIRYPYETCIITIKNNNLHLALCCRLAGAKSIVLVIIDGGADWVATQAAVVDKYDWIHFMHCVPHEVSLIIKDIFKIDVLAQLIAWITDAQKWFSTNRVGSLLQAFCKEHYGHTRKFVYPADTRFAGRLLQIHRFLRMERALRSTVLSAQYLQHNFYPDPFADKIAADDVWLLMERVTKATGPLLLLLRLGDCNGGTLSKLKGTVEYVKKQMVDSGMNTLEDKIAVAFNNRAPELECDISNAAYIIDPQFVLKSRGADRHIMQSFWTVSRKVLRIHDPTEWTEFRSAVVSELSQFRMKSDAFAAEDYTQSNTCAFWGAAGCHAPNLKRIALKLASLPCSSGEAERNWKEVKLTYTKVRNKLSTDKLAKVVFVRRFLRLKRAMCFGKATDSSGFHEWCEELLKAAAAPDSSTSSGSESDADARPFVDWIQPGEEKKCTGTVDGKRVICLTKLKKDQGAKSWLFHKYYKMYFVDKNPEDPAAEAEPLQDPRAWEHRVVQSIDWWRGHGFSVMTALRGTVVDQSLEKYHINEHLHEMIRSSPYNVRPMKSLHNEGNDSSDRDGDGDDGDGDGEVDGEDKSDGDGDNDDDGDSDLRIDIHDAMDLFNSDDD